jgi:hypothetical protein
MGLIGKITDGIPRSALVRPSASSPVSEGVRQTVNFGQLVGITLGIRPISQPGGWRLLPASLIGPERPDDLLELGLELGVVVFPAVKSPVRRDWICWFRSEDR